MICVIPQIKLDYFHSSQTRKYFSLIIKDWEGSLDE